MTNQGPVGTEQETPESSLVVRQGELPGGGDAWGGERASQRSREGIPEESTRCDRVPGAV